MSDQRGKQWGRMVRAVWFQGHPAQFARSWRKAPGDGKKIAFRGWEHTKSTSFLSLKKKKNRRHKFNWLIKARRKEVAVNWLGAHKTNAGTCLAWLARDALSVRCHIIENVFYYCKTSHALQLPYCVPDKGWWNIKYVETVPTRLEDTARASLFAFRQLLGRGLSRQDMKRDQVWTTRCISGEQGADRSVAAGQGSAHKDVI